MQLKKVKYIDKKNNVTPFTTEIQTNYSTCNTLILLLTNKYSNNYITSYVIIAQGEASVHGLGNISIDKCKHNSRNIFVFNNEL